VTRKAGLPPNIANFKSIFDKELAELYKVRSFFHCSTVRLIRGLWRAIPAIDPSEAERNTTDLRFVREHGNEVFADTLKLATVPPTALVGPFK
jgi:hypothetical protein